MGHVDDTPVAFGSLVGRETELDLLRQGLDAALEGRSQLFLVAGEAGIGKSRLADEIARSARDRNVLVAWGRCWEAGGAPAYWPWVQVLRTCLRESGGPTAQDPVVAQVVEELAQLRADAASPSTAAGSARFDQFDAVTTFLLDAARRRTILLLLDDLQSADAPSLLLLRFLANQMDEAPLMVVATFRREDLLPDRPLTEAVADLTRLPSARRIELAGLDGPEVARMVQTVTGVRPSAAVTAALLHETAGNPFFVSEISRLASTEGRLEESDPTYWERTIPQGVRQVVGMRVDRLSRECARVLSVASVLGRDFAVQQLTQLSGLELEDLDEILDEAVRAGLVGEDPLAPGAYRFSHAVVRDTLYDELPASHRARLHVQAGEILDSDTVTSGGRSAKLAHHFFHAGPRAGPARTVAWARQAGDDSLALLAYEEAVRLYGMALTALTWADAPDRQAECDLRLALADAASRAGDRDLSKREYSRAADLAEALDDRRSFAQAALGYGGRFLWFRADGDPKMMPMLERALASLGDDDLHLKVRLMARVTGAKRGEHDPAPRIELGERTVALAHRTGDPGVLAYALAGRHAALLAPAHAGWHVSPDELLAVATEAGNRELVFEAHTHRLVAFLEQGDIPSALRALAQQEEIARDLHQPAQRWLTLTGHAMFALLRGDMDDAEQLIAEAMSVGLQAESWDARVFADTQWFLLRREQARHAEMRDRIQASVKEYPTRPLFACMAAAVAVDLGQLADARAVVDMLAADRFGGVPLNNDWSLSMSLLADVIHALGDGGRAQELYDVMLPAAGRCVETLEGSVGAIDHPLGLLASTTGQHDLAVDHLESGLVINERMGARPWAAHTRVALAEVLAARGGPDDAARARAELERAREVNAHVGSRRLAERIDAVLASVVPAPRATRASTPAPARHGQFRCEGDVWVVGLDDVHHRIRGTKGLRYLATLLAAPGTQIHVLDLVGAVDADARRPGRGTDPDLRPVASGGADDVLDTRARAAYRERIEALQEEIDEAEQWNDGARASRAQEELDILIHELAAASGLGGRSRSFTTDAERARVNATRAIRAAVAKIGEHDAELSWHLHRSLRTGMFCCYEPDREAPVSWHVQ